MTRLLKHQLTELGVRVINRDGAFFDTLTVDLAKAGVGAVRIHAEAAKAGLNLRRISDTRVGLTLDETVTIEELTDVLNVFALALKPSKNDQPPFRPDDLINLADSLQLDAQALDTLKVSTAPARQPNSPLSASSQPVTAPSSQSSSTLPAVPDFARQAPFLTQPVFSAHRSETQMLR